MKHTALELIDKLIGCLNEWGWDSNEEYYLTVLVPSIVRSDGSARLMGDEIMIAAALRQLLSSEEWARLPELIADRRAQRLQELASDRERAEARQEAERQEAEERAKIKAEEERKQREIERERERQERPATPSGRGKGGEQESTSCSNQRCIRLGFPFRR